MRGLQPWSEEDVQPLSYITQFMIYIMYSIYLKRRKAKFLMKVLIESQRKNKVEEMKSVRAEVYEI